MAPPRLHLDTDTSMKALHTALVTRGHDVTRTPNVWITREVSDTEQLLSATAQGRVLFTFNTHDFPVLAQQYPHHGGLVLAARQVDRLWPHCGAGSPAVRDASSRLARASPLAESVAAWTDVRAAYGHDSPLHRSDLHGVAQPAILARRSRRQRFSQAHQIQKMHR